MMSEGLRKLAARSEPTRGEMPAESAGADWALNSATYAELWALENVMHALWEKDQDVPLSLRIAQALGEGPDVFWYQMRGTSWEDVSHEEAYSFMSGASRIFLDYCMEMDRNSGE
jgi:hypothetical protein